MKTRSLVFLFHAHINSIGLTFIFCLMFVFCVEQTNAQNTKPDIFGLKDIAESATAVLNSPLPNYFVKSDSFQVEVWEVERKEVFDKYIWKTQKDGEIYLEIFDGTQMKNVTYPESEFMVDVSQDQQYYTLTKIRKGSVVHLYETEIRNASDEIIAKITLEPFDSDESEDEIFPLNNGEGLVQKAFFMGAGFKFKVFSLVGNEGLSQKMFFDKNNYDNPKLTVSEENRTVLISYEILNSSRETIGTGIESFDLLTSKRWKREFKNIVVKSKLYISAFDGTISFVGKKAGDENNKYLYILNEEGLLSGEFKVYKGGLYNLNFEQENGTYLLLAPSDGAFFYIINLDELEVANDITTIDPSFYVQSMISYKGVVIAAYFKGEYNQINKKQDFLISEAGIIIIDMNGNAKVIPLSIEGYPKIFKNENGIYIICNSVERKERKQKIYRINIY